MSVDSFVIFLQTKSVLLYEFYMLFMMCIFVLIIVMFN
jgi:hypothetical protein